MWRRSLAGWPENGAIEPAGRNAARSAAGQSWQASPKGSYGRCAVAGTIVPSASASLIETLAPPRRSRRVAGRSRIGRGSRTVEPVRRAGEKSRPGRSTASLTPNRTVISGRDRPRVSAAPAAAPATPPARLGRRAPEAAKRVKPERRRRLWPDEHVPHAYARKAAGGSRVCHVVRSRANPEAAGLNRIAMNRAIEKRSGVRGVRPGSSAREGRAHGAPANTPSPAPAVFDSAVLRSETNQPCGLTRPDGHEQG
jgi:hypothetical protein